MKTRLFTLLKELAFLRQAVTLASGERSAFYFDCRQVFLRGDAQFLLGELFFAEMLKAESHKPAFTACGGMAIGCIPLTCALSAAAFRHEREFPGVFVRKSAKDHGTQTVVEGVRNLSSNANILLVEDVVTSGSSALMAAGELKKLGAKVGMLFCIIDREQGGKEALHGAGIELVSLFKSSDFVSDR